MMIGRDVVVVLGHQGGWDELLLFGGPVVLAIWVVRRMERRRRREQLEVDETRVRPAEPDPQRNGGD